MEEIQIFDQEGQEQDWNWLAATFGNVWVERARLTEGVSAAYRVTKLQDRSGPAVQVVNVAHKSGQPLEGVTVVRYWPDAPELPVWPAPISAWLSKGVFGKTNENGDIGYGMGQGDFYFSPLEGASSLWVADEAGPSDLIRGLGMIGGSKHRHLDVYYQLVEEVYVPSEQPPGGPPVQPPIKPPGEPGVAPEEPPALPPHDRWRRLIEKLDEIIALLETHVG